VQALAFLEGRGYAVPDDVKQLAEPVLAHRIMLQRTEGGTAEKLLVIRRILEQIDVPL
jgi:MoxR-like ATPase